MGKIVGLAIAFVALSVLFGIVERIWPGKRQPWWRRGIKTDLGWWFFDPLVGQAVGFVAVVLGVLVTARLAGVPLDKEHIKEWANRDTAISAQPAWVQALEGLLWFDFIGYWSHRAFHRIE